jgi:hypothetical protein
VVDFADSTDRVLSLVVVDSSVFDFYCRPSFNASRPKQGVLRRVSTSVLGKYIIGKEVFNALATAMDQKVIGNACFCKHFF